MAENITTYTDQSVAQFIAQVENERKRADSHQLIALMEKLTGEKAKMFGPTIVGFGTYHYKYASGHEGMAPLLGFSPRKSAISLYVYTGLEAHQHLLDGLGKYTMGKACIYIKKLSDINEEVLTTLMQETITYLEQTYTRK